MLLYYSYVMIHGHWSYKAGHAHVEKRTHSGNSIDELSKLAFAVTNAKKIVNAAKTCL